MSQLLPEGFAELEPLVSEWAISDAHQRYEKRVSSTQQELKAFYDQMFPLLPQAREYLGDYEYGKPLPEPAENLLNLLFTHITISLAIEVWRQPRVTDSADIIMTRVTL